MKSKGWGLFPTGFMLYAILINFFFNIQGEILENHREIGLPGVALGAVHHAKRRLSATDQLNVKYKS